MAACPRQITPDATYQISPGGTTNISLLCSSCDANSTAQWNVLRYSSNFFTKIALAYNTTKGTQGNVLTVTASPSLRVGTQGYVTIGISTSNHGSDAIDVNFVVVQNAPPPASELIFGAEEYFNLHHQAQNSTLNLYGASKGNECVATVQAIIHNNNNFPFVGGSKPGDPTTPALLNVDLFRNAMKADTTHWARVSEASAVRGDVWVQGDGNPGAGGQAHVGICINANCALVESNSSGNESFTWQASPETYQAYYAHAGFPNKPGGYWHHL